MTTYMTWETAGGKKGRCDAKCHNAKGLKCRCMCAGIMHGQAVARSPQQWQQYRDEKAFEVFAKMTATKDAGEIKDWLLRPEAQQLPLQEVNEK